MRGVLNEEPLRIDQEFPFRDRRGPTGFEYRKRKKAKLLGLYKPPKINKLTREQLVAIIDAMPDGDTKIRAVELAVLKYASAAVKSQKQRFLQIRTGPIHSNLFEIDPVGRIG